MDLEIGLNNLESFRNILPDPIYQKMGYGNEPFRERIRNFLEEQFLISADDQMLAGMLVGVGPAERVRRDDMTGEPLPAEDEPETVVTAQFTWPMQERPKKLDINVSLRWSSRRAADI